MSEGAPSAGRDRRPEAEFDIDARANGREHQLLLVRLLPNLVSILALCCGLTAVRFALTGNISTAVLLIAAAAFLDGIDGRLARLLRSESAIGAELDSLCDFVNFGVVPGLVLYLWGLGSAAKIGWMAVLIYAVCCMLRLARFNVGNRKAEPSEKHVFIGVPSPAGAMLALLPIYLTHATGLDIPEALSALWMVAMGVLMISRMRTPSLKRVRISSNYAAFALVGAMAAVAAVATFPWVTLLLLSITYLLGLGWLSAAPLRRALKRR